MEEENDLNIQWLTRKELYLSQILVKNENKKIRKKIVALLRIWKYYFFIQILILQIYRTYLFKHDSVVVIHACSFRKYKKRIIVCSLNMFPQPESKSLHLQQDLTINKENLQFFSQDILSSYNFTILCLRAIEPDTSYTFQDSALQ